MGKTILDDDPEFGRSEPADPDPPPKCAVRVQVTRKTMSKARVSRIDKFDVQNWHILPIFNVSKFGAWRSLTRLPPSYGNTHMRRSLFAPIKDTSRAD